MNTDDLHCAGVADDNRAATTTTTTSGGGGVAKDNGTTIGGGDGTTTSNGFKSKPVKVKTIIKKKKVMRPKQKKVLVKKGGGGELVSDKSKVSTIAEVDGSSNICADKVVPGKEEVEEGELGTLKEDFENGEFKLVKPLIGETEKGELFPEKSQKGEFKSGEVTQGNWRKENVQEKIGFGRGESAKWKYGGSFRRSEDDFEKVGFNPRKWQWHLSDMTKNAQGYGRGHRHDSGKPVGWKGGDDYERMPPSEKYADEGVFYKKDFNKSGSQPSKKFPRLESGLDMDSRIGSKIVYHGDNDHGNGKFMQKNNSSTTKLKRPSTHSDGNVWKNNEYGGGYVGTKSRRLSDYNDHSAYPGNYAARSAERSYENSSSSRKSSYDRPSYRHYDSSYDRHSRSPAPSDRSPCDPYDWPESSQYEYRERSPDDWQEHSPDYWREPSPYGRRERSPSYRRERWSYDRREKSPHGRKERPPYDRNESSIYDKSHRFDSKKRSPANRQRSPLDRPPPSDHRDRTPSYLDSSLLGQSRSNSHRDSGRKSSTNEKHYGQLRSKSKEVKINLTDPDHKKSHLLAKESQDKSTMLSNSVSHGKTSSSQSPKQERLESLSETCGGKPDFNEVPEELVSMEEDMDICDTPPHSTKMADSSTGKWFYLDCFGVEQGPSKLSDLKPLVKEGVLASDHFIKHVDSNRWVTLENAASPLVVVNFPSIVSDAVTQLVIHPEAPGNILVDIGDTLHSGNQVDVEEPVTSPHVDSGPIICSTTSEELDDLQIDERVGSLLKGFTFTPGRELETFREVLHIPFEDLQWGNWENSEGTDCYGMDKVYDSKLDETEKLSEFTFKEVTGSSVNVLNDKDYGNSDEWFSGRWSCRGGDWKRNDEGYHDKVFRKKLVQNDGFPLCQMPKSGYKDPRWHKKDELYYPSQSRKLDLPSWAFGLNDDNDSSALAKSNQLKPAIVKAVKGTILPVVRINTCVVQDHGSFVSDSHIKVRGRERYSWRSAKPCPAITDIQKESTKDESCSRDVHEQHSQGFPTYTAPINYPKDRLCTANDLQLHKGDWYYLDGCGRERGPSSLSEMQALVDQGNLQKYSSIFRKIDNVWVPVSSAAEPLATAVKKQEENTEVSGYSSLPPSELSTASDGKNPLYNVFNSLHPQFIGYTCGKLHELVMKSYRSREFAAAVNEALDPWIGARQPKMENHISNHALDKIHNSSRFFRSDEGGGKRACLEFHKNNDECSMEEYSVTFSNDDSIFEDLCNNVHFKKEESPYDAVGSWGLLDSRMLARVFHFLRADIKSLAFAAVTCKHWRSVVTFYKDISSHVDLSSVGPRCTDSMMWNIVSGYNKEKLSSITLIGCTSITSTLLEDILGSFPLLSSIDIRGCNQFGELVLKIPTLNWRKSRTSDSYTINKESSSRTRSLKHITESTSTASTTFKGVGRHTDDSDQLRDYFDSVDRRESANQLFHQSLYRRSKLFDARKSSSILSRDARLRRWTVKKSDNWYKKMEGFLFLGLKNIMKENTFEFFVPKVAEIEDRMKIGYYADHGVSSFKDDVSRMCRDALKARNRNDTGDVNHVVTLFIELAAALEQSSKSSRLRDNMMKTLNNDSPAGFGSGTSKYRKKINKVVSEKKCVNKSNGVIYSEYASDQEIRKQLSKLNRKSLDSGSETSADLTSSENDSECTDSETESDLEFRSEVGTRESREDGHFTVDDGLESLIDEREWGARMTKAGLVPPITRKYEVIDHYVIVADEEEVRRKMRVSLPEDYAEKITAQKKGIEDSDMEIPEVKEYKPRKELGDEVLEQEVYGIDPYTHNLVLDSMQELDWPLPEKHLFIEDVILCTLNKQVRHFTGTGNTPMVYPLQPVIEDLQRSAEEVCDIRTARMCQGLLKAISSRANDNYVSYRKGLGVVCNKEGGFDQDDFVVEFLGEVYPAWKWFEKQDGIRSLQKNSKEPAPEFYNIYLERPKGDADGYDLVVVDAMHKANYASRICHSCRPNCEAKVTAVDGHYQIGIYALRQIQYGEEITFDYNSVTESKEEYEASVCLCGSQVCRGSYLNLTGEGAFQKVLKEWHGILDRHQLMIEACELNSVSEEDYIDLGRAGLGSCLLGGLPNWLIAYAAQLVRFINFERTKLPEEILKHNLEEKRKYFADIFIDVEKSDAEVQAEGVYNQRLQNLVLTIDKVRYVMRCVFGDPKKAPPPLERLTPHAAVSFLWKGDGSLVKELLQCIAPHMDGNMLNDLKSKIRAHDPLGSDDVQKELQKSLLWLRDEVRNLPCTYKCRHDAAADLIHLYAHTQSYFRLREYKSITSPPVFISPLDMGPKYSNKLGDGLQEYCKKYGENYCLGQLIFWHNQTSAEPDSSLARSSRGCLSLPDIGSFYAKLQIPSRQRVYGPNTVKFMLAKMEKQAQKPWPKDRIWSFKGSPKIFGSPMLDSALSNTSLNKEMVHWLKNRPAIFQAKFDR